MNKKNIVQIQQKSTNPPNDLVTEIILSYNFLENQIRNNFV